MSTTKVAVVGASGYSGEELVRLLLAHPSAEIVCITSRQSAGRSVGEVFPRFRGLPGTSGLQFELPNPANIAGSGATLAFLALPHGAAAEIAVPLIEAGIRVIDLSADFRLRDPAVYAEFYGHPHPAPNLLTEAVYGLPERRSNEIRNARLVASPGCYPTSILLPLCPLLERGILDPAGIVISSMSGVSGAGRKADVSLLFAECNESVRAYGLPKHRHLSEIEQELSSAAGGNVRVTFNPHLVPITRGIQSTITARPSERGAERRIAEAYAAVYGKAPFVRLLGGDGPFPDTRHVALTNFIDIAWRFDDRTGTVILLSAEDNLTKGAAGQAIQSFNLMCGFPEIAGLL